MLIRTLITDRLTFYARCSVMGDPKASPHPHAFPLISCCCIWIDYFVITYQPPFLSYVKLFITLLLCKVCLDYNMLYSS